MDNGAQIRPLHRAIVCSPSGTASKQIPEQIAENISHILTAEIKAAKPAESASSGAAFECCMAELIILLPLLRIAQYSIRFRRFLEFLLGSLIPGFISG